MSVPISPKGPTFIVSTIGVFLILILIGWLTIGRPAHSSPVNQVVVTNDQAPPVVTESQPGLPKRLKIPSIKVDAAIDQVGLTTQGAMGVPTILSSTGWYDLGPRPGAKGNAVIDGHFGWVKKVPAIFNNLHKLKAGDTVYVEDDQGATLTFVVRTSRSYPRNENPPSVFTANDDQAHLNLITCEGVWSQAKHSYSDRLVVFTDKV